MSTFGTYFKVTTFGESHGSAVGCIVDGVPPRMALDVENDIQPQSDRRKPGQSSYSSPRAEKDKVMLMSGVENGYTLGTPICLMINNEDAVPQDYQKKHDDKYASFSEAPRPSHADWTYLCKYGVHVSSGGGRSSARETAARVAAGSIAEKWLKYRFGMEIVAFVYQVGDVSLNEYVCHSEIPSERVVELERYINTTLITSIDRKKIDETVIRTVPLFPQMVSRMKHVIESAKEQGDSVGGAIMCFVRKQHNSMDSSIAVGFGEPCFEKLEAKLAQAMLSLPACRSFEIGSGYDGSCLLSGSRHNDPFRWDSTDRPSLRTASNHSGGIQGGISNGEPIVFKIAFKPPASIGKVQATANFSGEQVQLKGHGRHDPCVLTRAIPLVEAMTALVLADAAMAQLARCSASRDFSVNTLSQYSSTFDSNLSQENRANLSDILRRHQAQ